MAQSCVTLTSLSHELKTHYIETLKAINASAWRKRAWILQEILLSREYILSGEDATEIKLGGAGTLALLLFQLHSEETWLGAFASWCRRLFRLRLYYFDYKICPSNILQFASSPESVLPCDKYYALCGLLRLKDLEYKRAHSERQAWDAVILALPKSRRLPWLPAILPSLSGTISLDTGFLPYVERRLDMGLSSFYANTKNSSISRIGFDGFEVGHVAKIRIALEVLNEAMPFANNDILDANLPAHLAVVPALLLTICREFIETLTAEPIIGRLCRVLEVSKNVGAGAKVLMKLLAIPNPKSFSASSNQNREASLQDVELEAGSAWMIQRHAKSALHSVYFIEWNPIGKPEKKMYAAGSKRCEIGSEICMIKGDSLLVTVRLNLTGARFAQAE